VNAMVTVASVAGCEGSFDASALGEDTTMTQTLAQRIAARFQAACPCAAPKEPVAVAPPGWEGTVKEMKKDPDIDNPWALAWSMKNKGYESHKANIVARFKAAQR